MRGTSFLKPVGDGLGCQSNQRLGEDWLIKYVPEQSGEYVHGDVSLRAMCR